MTRRFTGSRLVVASHNAGKVREIAVLLAPVVTTVIAAAELGLPEPEETADSFAGNAALKAVAAATASGEPALADDSGLSVDALDGKPGIYSARWAGPSRDFSAAMRKIKTAILDIEARDGKPANRRACFVCALSLAWLDGHVETVEGECPGSLVWPPRGGNGFGYDPIFVPDGHSWTFAEFNPEAKAAINHRAIAFNRMLATVFGKT